MMRATISCLMAMTLTLASLALANARGANHDIGLEIVICSGVGMTTISVGPDGQPVERVEACPDGTSIFAVATALPDAPDPAPRLIGVLATMPVALPAPRNELSPSARGPPALA
jgi:hypothetical protein